MQRLIPFFLGITILVVVGLAAVSITTSTPEYGAGAILKEKIIGFEEPEQSTSTGAVYAPFERNAIGHGQKAVLFFAGSDPFSAKADTVIQSVVASGALTIPVYRVDYDNALGARVDFAVIVPDTFVLVSGSGSRTSSLIHPSAKELRELLTGAHTSK